MLHALFNQALGFDDLAALELAVFVSLLQQVTQVGLAIALSGIFVGAGNFQGGGQRDGAALHAFDQAFLPLVEQEDDVFDVFGRQARLLDDDLCAVATFAQHLDVGQDLQGTIAAPGDVLGQAHDEGVFVGHVPYQTEADASLLLFASFESKSFQNLGSLRLRLSCAAADTKLVL